METNETFEVVIPEVPNCISNEQIFAYIPIASNTSYGIIKPDNITLEITNNVIKIKSVPGLTNYYTKLEIDSLLINKSNATNIENGAGNYSIVHKVASNRTNVANGNSAVVFGKLNKSNGNTSFVIGQENEANGAGTFVAGVGNLANRDYQTVVGRYADKSNFNKLFQVGDGTDVTGKDAFGVRYVNASNPNIGDDTYAYADKTNPSDNKSLVTIEYINNDVLPKRNNTYPYSDTIKMRHWQGGYEDIVIGNDIIPRSAVIRDGWNRIRSAAPDANSDGDMYAVVNRDYLDRRLEKLNRITNGLTNAQIDKLIDLAKTL